MASVNRAAAAVAGLTILGVLAISLLWSIFGGMIKVYTPHEFGYSRLGWVHAGRQTVYSVGIPKWAGWQGFASALQSPFRHYKVYLKQGQRLVIDYKLQIDRGAMSFSVYRTNLSRLLQGARVENHKSFRFRRGPHSGTAEYTAPADGIYTFDYDIWWDRRTRKQTFPLPDYKVTYDIRWRLER